MQITVITFTKTFKVCTIIIVQSFRRFLMITRKNIFIAKSADIIGKVKMDKDCSVWFNAVIRADVNTITIGKRTNVQDGVVLHVDINNALTIGDNVSIGHNAVVHGCTVGNNVLIGMGSMILNGAKIGDNSIVGAGSVVTENKEFPPNSLILGSPARLIRTLTEKDVAMIQYNGTEYSELKKAYDGKSFYENDEGYIRLRDI